MHFEFEPALASTALFFFTLTRGALVMRGVMGRLTHDAAHVDLGEFHRPSPWLLRALSWTYFKVFEPNGLALWDSHDPVLQLQAMPGVTCVRHTAVFGNVQVIVASKAA